MSELGFPIKDLARRKFPTVITFIGLTFSTATTIFLIAFGESLGLHISIIASGKLTTGFSYTFSIIILLIGVLSFFTGILSTSFLVSNSMHYRTRDIGVMKAVGCSTSCALSYFITELSILVFVSCGSGTLIGFLINKLCINFLNVFGFSIPLKPVNLWVTLTIFLTFVIANHVLGVYPVLKAIKVRPAEAHGRPRQFGVFSSSKIGFPFKVAYRSLKRRRSLTLQAIVCLSAVLSLTTFTISSGMIANQTTQDYVTRAIGEDVVLLAHPNISKQYENFLYRFLEEKQIEQINYFDLKYSIPESLVTELGSIPGVIETDPRFILETLIIEVPGIVIDPEEEEPYTVIGDSRSKETLVQGVDPDLIINEWLIEGRGLNKSDVYSILIGDSLAYQNFDDAQKQSALIFDRRFEVVGVCLDPLNNGDVVYIPLKTLHESSHYTGYNLLLLKIDPINRLKIIGEIEERISGRELDYFEVNEVLDLQLAFLNSIWSPIIALPLLSLITASLGLLSYMMISFTDQQREIGVMRALGAKPKTVAKTIFLQALIIVLISGAIGFSAGFIITWFFLIPYASTSMLATILGWLFMALASICLTSLYPAMRALKRPIAQLMS